MRLSDFNPMWRRVYRDRHRTADNGGFPTDRYELSFTCPTCGPPFRVCVTVGPEMGENPRTWAATPLPDGVDWPSRVTLSPSINHTVAGHGRRHPTCGFHGSIINGEIQQT